MNLEDILEKLELITRINEKKVIIYPYGDIGRKIKKILNDKYQIHEMAIVDDGISKENDNIMSSNYFREVSNDDVVVILASDNVRIYGDLRENLRKYIPSEKVVDLFGWINIGIDRRIEALRLCADIINENKIQGAVAEAGVFEGDFAMYMNMFFKNRKLYLFDTFEGFENDKLKGNVDVCWKKWMEDNYSFVSSGIESIMKKMFYPENCIFKKGYFPDTTEGINEKFCFVNLDMDIYQSTIDGLEYFWAHLVKRGIIFVHDYFSWNCPGVRKAVDEFCAKYSIGFGCVPEINGTIMIVK